MSTFTRFSAVEQLQYDKLTSERYGKDIWSVVPGFRYYIGSEDSGEYVDVETGFKTDGATIPRFLWWILPPMGEYSQNCTLHDKLCQTYRKTKVINGVATSVPITRKEVDMILRESMLVSGVTPWKREFIMLGVNFYRVTTNPTTPKPVLQSFGG